MRHLLSTTTPNTHTGFLGKKGDAIEHYTGRDAGWLRYPKEFDQIKAHYLERNNMTQARLDREETGTGGATANKRARWPGWMDRWGLTPHQRQP